ncbi:PREDICTED: tRNA-dihydrouridine(20) synthase [NAD(P)+]-like [Drosophila arizonae]|uniref:tRNA-dihydrouridine(20) synthase [NAD(P)+]-like n=1 Tax=Drosophila arizonae TaxID=7263 RepID=A0ABM1PVY6_DROAR|nr:PREDICTED: tRNA-dihydrouridine(20) synthase [NAD(P)+]-like [Drosophila arizonae]
MSRFKWLSFLSNLPRLKMKQPRLDYRNKIIMAPMVRVGTLPMRLLALEMGADIVYTEELVDLKLIKSLRRPNPALNTIDFVDPSDGTIVFRTCSLETSRVVLQLGTSDAARALAVGKLVQNDIAGLDINMGCPKEFSIKGGMGAALLSEPAKAAHILRTLTTHLDIPITCKIRILPDTLETIKLVQELAATGIAAIGIHARTRDERPQHHPHPDVLRAVASAVDIPIIANGGSRSMHTYEDLHKFQELCGADSVMVARAAQLNVSIFRKQGMLPIDEVICKYLRLCVDYDNAPHNSKYCVQSILKELQETPRGKRFLQCQTLQQICEIWGLGDYCRRKQQELKEHGNGGRANVILTECLAKRQKLERSEDLSDEYEGVICRNMAFLRSTYPSDTQLPKMVLYVLAGKLGKQAPSYETHQCDKLFRSICSYDGQRFSSSFWEKNKKQAEQGAALVALLQLGHLNEKTLLENGSLIS